MAKSVSNKTIDNVTIRFAGDSGDGMQLSGGRFTQTSAVVGNDLSTPIPEYNFKGLTEGDSWCLCASRWQEAFEAGKAPKVILKSTNIATLSLVKLDNLKKYSV